MKNKERVKNENGYALLITLLALILITVIGLSLMTMAMNTARITKSERDNQSSYYIAEAGLVEKRAQINEVARQVFAELKAEYDLIKEPAIKKNFKLEEKFKVQVQERIKTSVVMTENQTYSEQYAESPESQVTVTSDVDQPLKYVITSVGKVPSEKGKPKEKTVSQTVEIKMIVPDSTDTIEIPGNNTVQKLKACYALRTTDDITLTNGTINGDIYTDRNFNIPYGNPTINGNIISKGNATISGGSPKKDIVSFNDITINAWISIGGSLVAKNNIIIKEGINFLGGKYIYGNTFKKNNILQKDPIPTKNIDVYLANYSPAGEGKCIESIPTLPDENLAFPSTKASILPNEKIVYNSNEHKVIQDGNLNINNYIVRDSNYKLILNKDVYFKEININENYTLKIDLQNQHRKIYVDSFNNIQGHIELINSGTLEIIVQNSFNSKGEINKSGKTDKMTIRYAGTGGITLSGESSINASFYIKRAPTLTIENIGNEGKGGIRGDLIIFGNTAVTFGGGASVSENLILAPNSSLTLKGGAAVKGNVIAKSFNINNYADGSITPPKQNSGEWEVPGSAPEIIEVPSYEEETTFLITDPLIQK